MVYFTSHLFIHLFTHVSLRVSFQLSCKELSRELRPKSTLFIIYLRPPDLKKLFKSRFQENEIEIIKIANNRFWSLVDFSFNLPLIGSLHS